MGLRSTTRDKRQFLHYAKIGADGTVLAIVEVAEGTPEPSDEEGHLYVDVTEYYPYDFSKVKVPVRNITTVKKAMATAAAGATAKKLPVQALTRIREALAEGRVRG